MNFRNIESGNDNALSNKTFDRVRSPGLLDLWITSSINSFLYDSPQNDIKIEELKKNILKYLKETVDINSVYGIQNSGRYIFLYYGEEDQGKFLVFDMLSNNGEPVDLEMIILENRQKNLEIQKKTESFENVLNAMDYIFNENEKECFDFLDNDDTLKTDIYGRDLKGKSIKQLQKLARQLLGELNGLRLGIHKKAINIDKIIGPLKERYLDFTMGIGDKYEGGAKLFAKNKEEIDGLIIDIIGSKTSIEDIFLYMSKKYEEMDRNNYQSTSIEESYSAFSKKLNVVVFERLKKENATDKQFLNLAKIVTGRSYKIGNKEFSGDIDDRLKDPSLSNEIILYIMGQKGGILERINNSSELEIEDSEIGNKLPKNIVQSFGKINIKSKSGTVIKGDTILKEIGFSDVINLGNQSYGELNIEQKIKISTLVRIVNQINEEGLSDLGNLQELFKDIAIKAQDTVIDGLNNNFDATIFDWNGKNSKDFGLKGIQAEIFDLYNDINGNGLFDLSDESIEIFKGVGKFALVIGAGILASIALAPILGGSLILTGVAVGVTASIASIAINPKGYNSLGEASVDIGSDLIVGGSTGAIGGALVGGLGLHGQGLFATKLGINGNLSPYIGKGFGVPGAKLFSKGGAINSIIFGLDISILGILTEAVRMKTIDEIYHGESIFQE